MEEAAEHFLEMIGTKRSAATRAQYRDFLERLVYPKFGKAKVAEVKHSDIARLHYELRGRKVTA
ncbi:MAG TPA: hypothetical protein VHK03_13290, partial [Aestuariivirgaceae bacterium]|nr:hypothetical protein [Aestuariivirgaceae bacterium]